MGEWTRILLADAEQIDRVNASTEYDAADTTVDLFKKAVPYALFGRKSGKSSEYLFRSLFAVSLLTPSYLSISAW